MSDSIATSCSELGVLQYVMEQPNKGNINSIHNMIAHRPKHIIWEATIRSEDVYGQECPSTTASSSDHNLPGQVVCGRFDVDFLHVMGTHKEICKLRFDLHHDAHEIRSHKLGAITDDGV